MLTGDDSAADVNNDVTVDGGSLIRWDQGDIFVKGTTDLFRIRL